MVFDFTIIGTVFDKADVVAFGKQEKTAPSFGGGVEKYVVRQNAGVIACDGNDCFCGGLDGGGNFYRVKKGVCARMGQQRREKHYT